MKVNGLDGKKHIINFSQYSQKPDRMCSDLHKKVRLFLKIKYPSDRIYEEVFLPGSDGLYADFFLPMRSLIIEANGRQHDEFVQHFHKNKYGFINSKKRDNKKQMWCDLNEISLIVFNYSDNEDQWKEKLL